MTTIDALNAQMSDLLRGPYRTVTDHDLEDCARIQAEEFEAIAAVYAEDCDIIDEHLIRVTVEANVHDLLDKAMTPDKILARFGRQRIALTFCLPPAYPYTVPLVELDVGTNMSAEEDDELYNALLEQSLELAASEDPGPMLYELTMTAVEHLERSYANRRREHLLVMIHTKAFIPPAAPKPSVAEAEEEGTHHPLQTAVDPATGLVQVVLPDRRRRKFGAPSELKVETVDGMDVWGQPTSDELVASIFDLPIAPASFIGPLAPVIRNLSSAHVSVVKIENILRYDLAQIFQAQWAAMRRKYPDDPALSEPVFGFHGTNTSVIPSIVREGLLVPGEATGVRVVYGERFGKGIYISPQAHKSLNYVSGRGGKILVCAVLRGKPFVGVPEGTPANAPHTCVRSPSRRRRCSDAQRSKYDSVESPDGLEYVLGSASQVLPCYVIDYHTEVLKGHQYHAATAGGAIVTVTATEYRPGGIADLDHSELSMLAELQHQENARKNAAFFLPSSWQVLEVLPADDSEDTTAHALVHGKPFYGDMDDQADYGDFQTARLVPRRLRAGRNDDDSDDDW